jgi:large subunit ribosomal protein L25
VKPVISDRDFTIATVAAPAGLKSEDNAAEATAETATETEAETEE